MVFWRRYEIILDYFIFLVLNDLEIFFIYVDVLIQDFIFANFWIMLAFLRLLFLLRFRDLIFFK